LREQMGLLDDAIREHLELKRLRGAEPGEVARLEQEALGPIRGTRPDPVDDHDEGHPDAVAAPPALDEEQTAGTDGAPEDWTETPQETAELDMQMYMDDGDSATALEHGHREERATAEEQPSSDGAPEDLLEETPEFLQETPEHERLWFEQQPPRDFDFDK
jgi:hypothetical protein